MPYSFSDHTADVRMEVWGKDLKELFRSALKGMTQILDPQPEREGKIVQRKLDLVAPDLTALLVDFLSEVLFLMHTYHEAYPEIRFTTLTPTQLKAQLKGFASKAFARDIKAVTYHEARVVKDPRGFWRTFLVFDL